MAREIQKLRRLARKWGGDLIRVSKAKWAEFKEEKLTDRTHPFYEAPFTSNDLGIHWPTRRVVYCGEVHWPEVIHEMGHTFATNECPDHDEEFNWFGWEYALAKHIGGNIAEWVHHNKDYGIFDDASGEFGDMTPKAREKLLRERIAKGQELGIIDAKGRPLPVKRGLDLNLLQSEIKARSLSFRQKVMAARQMPVANGNEFERRCEFEGFSQGYDQAIEDVMRLLAGMVTFPVSTST